MQDTAARNTEEDREARRVAHEDDMLMELRAAQLTSAGPRWHDHFAERSAGEMSEDVGGIDLNPGQLQVANERGEAMGGFIPPKAYTLDEAHNHFIRSKSQRPAQFEFAMRRMLTDIVSNLDGPVSERSKRGRENDEELPPSKRRRTKNGKPEDAARNALMQMMDLSDGDAVESEESERSSDESEMIAEEDGHMDVPARHLIERLPDPDDSETSEADACMQAFTVEDREYIEERFAKHLHNANLSADAFMKHTCPLCGFMDNQHDAIPDEELERIEHFLDAGIGNIDERTHADIVAFMWNKNIYEPMKRERKRCVKLTSQMAYEHITEPHRVSKPALKLHDARQLMKAQDLFFGAIFSENPVTSEPSVQRYNAQLALKCMEIKWKIIGVDDTKDPFNNAHRPTAAGASRSVNPMHATRTQTRKRTHQ